MRGILLNPVSSTQERGRANETSGQSQAFEQVSATYTFQNGRPTCSAGSPPERGLDVQNRLKGCIFCASYIQGASSAPTLPLENKGIPVACLPFGLSTAPWVFTKVLRPVIGWLRQKGVRCMIYLDDLLIMAKCKQEAANQCRAVTQLLESLEFLVNYTKSQVQPVQEVTFLGMGIDSNKQELSLPSHKLSLLLPDPLKSQVVLPSPNCDCPVLSSGLLGSVCGRWEKFYPFSGRREITASYHGKI